MNAVSQGIRIQGKVIFESKEREIVLPLLIGKLVGRGTLVWDKVIQVYNKSILHDFQNIFLSPVK